jgi:DNA polymerase
VRTTFQNRKLEDLAQQIRICVKCPLHTSRTIAVPGSGRAKAQLMIIGEAPGRDEDKQGEPFVGAAGRYLNQVLAGTGIAREDFFITNTVKCRPPKNRAPARKEIQICTGLYLSEQINLIRPKLILLLGSVAAKTLLGVKTVEEARGRVVDHDERQFVVTYHPASRFYREDLAAKIDEDFAFFKRTILRLNVKEPA